MEQSETSTLAKAEVHRVTAEMKDMLERLLSSEALTMTDLAKKLAEASGTYGMGKDQGRLNYDAASVAYWTHDRAESRKPISRAAAWLLDTLYPQFSGGAFQVLRDRYALASDQAVKGVPDPGERVNRRSLGYPRCRADFIAQGLERRQLIRPDGTALHWAFLSVVNCNDSRALLKNWFAENAAFELLAMYDLQGHWDLAVKFSAPSDVEVADIERGMLDVLDQGEMRPRSKDGSNGPFSARRLVTVKDMEGLSESEPRFFVLPSNEEYVRLRVQRAWILVDLEPLNEVRRPLVIKRLRDDIRSSDEVCHRIVESITNASDAILVEIAMTCADQTQMDTLQEVISEGLSLYEVQKYSLIAYHTDEEGWLRQDGSQ